MNSAILAAETASANSTGEQVTFWICAVLIVVGALGLVLSRKTVHSALFVVMTMISLAILYAANGAPFLALVQVIVYTGAIMMLFLFVVMLVGVDSSDSLIETIKGQRVAAILLVLGFGLILVIALLTLPAAIAGHYLHSLGGIMLLATLLGSAFTSAGLALAFSPDLPAGPTIILLAGTCYVCSAVISELLKRYRARRLARAAAETL